MASPEVKRLLAVLRNPANNWNDVSSAISRLETVATIGDLPVLHAAIESDPGFYLGEVVGPIVGELEGISALPFLLRTLRRGQARRFDHDGLASHITELVTSSGAAVVPILAEMSRSDTVARRNAAWLWGFVDEFALLEPLLGLSRDPDPHVVRNAIGSLTSYKGREDVYQRFVEALADEDEEMRTSAISALGYYGDARAVPLLRPFTEDDSETVRHIAEYALRQLG